MFKSHPSARWLIGLLDGRKRTPFDMIDVMNEKSSPGCQVSFKGRPRLQEMFDDDLGGDDDNNDDSRGHRQRAGRGGAVLQQLGGRGGKDCPPHLSSLPSDILQVKRSVPAERLLVHSAKQVSLGSLTTSYLPTNHGPFPNSPLVSATAALPRPPQGWEPLCKFLDLPVPEGPYPRVNDTASIQKMVGRRTPTRHT